MESDNIMVPGRLDLERATRPVVAQGAAGILGCGFNGAGRARPANTRPSHAAGYVGENR